MLIKKSKCCIILLSILVSADSLFNLHGSNKSIIGALELVQSWNLVFTCPCLLFLQSTTIQTLYFFVSPSFSYQLIIFLLQLLTSSQSFPIDIGISYISCRAILDGETT